MNTALAPLMSSKRDDWATPPEVLGIVREALGGSIALDLCSGGFPIPGIPNNYDGSSPALDGLAQTWRGFGPVYANPPYGRKISLWVRKACDEFDPGIGSDQLVFLSAAKPDTLWFKALRSSAQAMCFWQGRIKFVGAVDVAPFPSLFTYWGDNVKTFSEAMDPHGWVVRL